MTHLSIGQVDRVDAGLKIRKRAFWFLVGIIFYIIAYIVLGVTNFLDFAFLSPIHMEKHWMTGGVVTSQIRWLHFAVWAPVYAAGLYAMGQAIVAVQWVRRGQWFKDGFGKAVFQVGVGVILSAGFDIVATLLRRPILSMANPNGQLDVYWRFRSEEFGLVFCGIGFCALGWLMRQAAIIAEDNDGFV